MATYFGEVQELSSRAIETLDQDELSTYSLTVKLTENYKSGFECKSVIFCVGDIAVAFSSSYLDCNSSKHLFDVYYSCMDKENDPLLYGGNTNVSKNKIAVTVRSTETNTVVCDIPFNIPDEINVEILEIILQHIECSTAVVLTSAPNVTFKGDLSESTNVPRLMYLASSEFILPPSFDILLLQSPNFVSCMPAAVLTEFEIRKKPALCVINYTESNLLDFHNVQIFEKVILLDIIQKLNTVECKSKLVNYIKKHSSTSNLYI